MLLLQLSPAVLLLLLAILGSINAQPFRNKQPNDRRDVIQKWIRTIQEAPKGHSMSPSWTSRSRPQVIGVGELPLQNEAVTSSRPRRGFKHHQTAVKPPSQRYKRYQGMYVLTNRISRSTQSRLTNFRSTIENRAKRKTETKFVKIQNSLRFYFPLPSLHSGKNWQKIQT